MIDISGENVVLVGALLLFVAVMAGKVAYRFGAMQAFEYADLEYRPLTRLQISPLKEEACEA